MSRGTPTTPFRIDPALKARAQARATREGTTLTAIVVAAIEAYAAGETEPKPTTTQDQCSRPFAAVRRAPRAHRSVAGQRAERSEYRQCRHRRTSRTRNERPAHY